MVWNCEIDKAENGYVLKYFSEYDDGSPREEKFVFEETCDENSLEDYKTDDSEKVAFSKMVEWLGDYFGLGYNKHGKENFNASWDKKGKKYEDE